MFGMVRVHPTHSMDLNLLTALDALLVEGSVAKAAARTGLSAPAMSRTLTRIREATGDAILVRAGRGLVPTPRALAMRERVRAAAAEARALLSPAAEPDLTRVTRAFSLRADDAVTAVVGPALLARVQQYAPGLTLVFRPEAEEDVTELRDGRIDLDIGVQGSLGPEVRTRALVSDERVVLVRAGRSRPRRPLTLRQFAAASHVDVSRRGRRRGPADELLAQHGLVRRVAAVVPNQLAAAVLVAQTDLVSLVSRRFASAVAATLNVAFSPPPEPLGRVQIELAWHPRFDGDAIHRWIREQLIELARALS